MAVRLIVLVAVVAVSAVLAVVLRRRDGRVRAVVGSAGITADALGVPLGTTATLVQFSTSTCAPCRAVRRVLTEVAADRPDVVHVEVDAERRTDLVRLHRVFTTPTVLLLSADGGVRQRLTGAVDRRDVAQALGALSWPSPAELPHG